MCSLFADGMRSQWTRGHFARRYFFFFSVFFFCRRSHSLGSYFMHSPCFLHAMDISRFFILLSFRTCCAKPTSTTAQRRYFLLFVRLLVFFYFVECFVWRESYLHIYVCFSLSGFQQRDGYRHHRFNNTRCEKPAWAQFVVRRWLVSKLKCKKEQKQNELLHFIISIAPSTVCIVLFSVIGREVFIIICWSFIVVYLAIHVVWRTPIDRMESQSKMKLND